MSWGEGGTQGVWGSIGSNSFLKAGFHLVFVRSVASVLTAWRTAEMPPTTPVPTQRELTALNFGEKILLSCRLDSLSEGRVRFTAHAGALLWDHPPTSFPHSPSL